MKKVLNPFTGTLQFLGFEAESEDTISHPLAKVSKIVFGVGASGSIAGDTLFLHATSFNAGLTLRVIATDPVFPNASIVERGYVITGLNMNWSVNAPFSFANYETLRQNGILINGDSSGADNGPFDPETYTAAIPEATHGSGITAVVRGGITPATDKTDPVSGRINWRTAVYYGENLLTTMIEAEIEALRIKTLSKTSSGGTYNMVAGGYKWWWFPASFAQPNTFTDQATGFPIAMEPTASPGSPQVVSVTNAYGYTENYNGYRTLNILGGALTAIIG